MNSNLQDVTNFAQPDIIYYGPHPCETCGHIIVKASREQGGYAFDWPRGIIYPNHNWTQHVCPPKPEVESDTTKTEGQ